MNGFELLFIHNYVSTLSIAKLDQITSPLLTNYTSLSKTAQKSIRTIYFTRICNTNILYSFLIYFNCILIVLNHHIFMSVGFADK